MPSKNVFKTRLWRFITQHQYLTVPLTDLTVPMGVELHELTRFSGALRQSSTRPKCEFRFFFRRTRSDLQRLIGDV